MSTIDRKDNQVFWIFSKDSGKIKSIERMVYKAVINKKNFTLDIYRNEFGKQNTIKNS